MALSDQIKIGDNLILQKRTREVAQDVLRMGALVEESFRYSHRALFEQDVDAVNKIITQDKEIDRYYRQIELDCANILSQQNPSPQNLRMISAFMQLVRDLERIGDYAQDLAEISRKLITYPVHPTMKDIAIMSQQAQLMLGKSIVALTELDAGAGEKIKFLDDTVDDAYDHLYQVLAYQKNIIGVVEPIILLILVIRYLERMADHSTNIAQRVSYIVNGYRN
ncbi:MAG: phosphate signaling complex protein PhoU [Cyanobacterium sp. T60_A2020_053]|nr:phosphate signaling complex protein PhoU [Cyanobacterium sp. T60_A2020_053]